jgi:hypothetical protein
MAKGKFTVKIPVTDGTVQQGEEQFIIEYNGKKKRVRAHDYDEIYKIPGLYEHLFYENYKCKSPDVICSMLSDAIEESVQPLSNLKVLDVGAGNGIMGEKLKEAGVDSIVGLDIIEEAAESAERDRPDVYDDYFVEDLTNLSSETEEKLEELKPNCMTVVAALGFDDIPPDAFAEGYNKISNPGWIAFNIKDQFYCENDCSGFYRLIKEMIGNDVFNIASKKRYRHRLCQDGTPLYYYAIVGRKNGDITDDLLKSCQE